MPVTRELVGWVGSKLRSMKVLHRRSVRIKTMMYSIKVTCKLNVCVSAEVSTQPESGCPCLSYHDGDTDLDSILRTKDIHEEIQEEIRYVLSSCMYLAMTFM